MVNADIYINKNFWNKLPKDVQAIFETAAMASLMDTMAYRIRANTLAEAASRAVAAWKNDKSANLKVVNA